jgi:hypothetical protein
VLKQQAALLGKHTSNLLEARVVTLPAPGGFRHVFLILIPTLGYQHELFNVTHDLKLYPVNVTQGNGVPNESLESEDDLVAWLKLVLNSAETRRILSTLMVQAEA